MVGAAMTGASKPSLARIARRRALHIIIPGSWLLASKLRRERLCGGVDGAVYHKVELCEQREWGGTRRSRGTLGVGVGLEYGQGAGQSLTGCQVGRHTVWSSTREHHGGAGVTRRRTSVRKAWREKGKGKSTGRETREHTRE
eukprot:scaffold122101_cov34-Tisochrysis_lutea.AAC.7